MTSVPAGVLNEKEYESKMSDNDFGQAKEDKRLPNPQELVERVQEYFYTNDDLAAEFEQFVSEKAIIFMSAVDVDTNLVSEYKLEYTTVYEEYKALFEQRLESFIESQGVSVVDFFDILQMLTAQDADSSESLFGMMLLAVTEFDVFIQMMKEAASCRTPYDSKAADKLNTKK